MTRPSLADIEKRDALRVHLKGAGAPALMAEKNAASAADVPALTAAVRDVLALHQEDGHGECSHCPDPSDAHWSAPYPCPTVRALAAHLDLTDPEGEPT